MTRKAVRESSAEKGEVVSTLLVGILMGSDSDSPIMEEAASTLDQLRIGFEMRICSAHRTPEKAAQYAKEAEGRGIKVLIAGAGAAAHLAGALAAHTTLPVIGIPLSSSPLQGLDALLATVQMPSGVPVATMALDQAGARNAAIFAAQILALRDPDLASRLKVYKERMSKGIEEKDRQLQTRKGSSIVRSQK
jgi:phosphoribosylaminoimidazole carboxylase PurE protein